MPHLSSCGNAKGKRAAGHFCQRRAGCFRAFPGSGWGRSGVRPSGGAAARSPAAPACAREWRPRPSPPCASPPPRCNGAPGSSGGYAGCGRSPSSGCAVMSVRTTPARANSSMSGRNVRRLHEKIASPWRDSERERPMSSSTWSPGRPGAAPHLARVGEGGRVAEDQVPAVARGAHVGGRSSFVDVGAGACAWSSEPQSRSAPCCARPSPSRCWRGPR